MFDAVKYKNDFNKTAYDTIKIQLPKGKKAILQDIANGERISMNKAIIQAIEYYYNIDISSKEKVDL